MQIVSGIIFLVSGIAIIILSVLYQQGTFVILGVIMGWLASIAGAAGLGQQMGFYKCSHRR